ncbi:hypothetical protein [Salininema proteolyticum]|uniref:MYXO-CTERM domain-containing protein n=1 Tax=Salininema proteolyticum TaxID=1607685 RepID=A0ABV8U0B5_9ACTN
MSDPYRFDDRTPPRQSGEKGVDGANALLWVGVAVLAGANTAMSLTGRELLGALFGGGAVVLLAVLGLRYVARRRR